jgi:hypothetical protein
MEPHDGDFTQEELDAMSRNEESEVTRRKPTQEVRGRHGGL